MKLVAIGKEGRVAQYTRDKALLERYHLVQLPNGAGEAEILQRGGDADFLLVDAITPVTASLIEKMPNLKLIHSEGVAFDKIDLDAARARKIYVCNCKGMNAGAVAEQAVLLMLGLLRQVCSGDRNMRAGNQIKIKEGYMADGSLCELGECTVGLVGFGDIAKATARLTAAFGAKNLYYSRSRASEAVERACGAAYRPLDELLAQSDIVSLHLPVTDETRNFADAAFFARMKPGAYFVNTARGELVDEQALLEALANGHLAGAGLDTVRGEPVSANAAIFGGGEDAQRKILYSCHVGGITGASFRRGYEMIWHDIALVAAGQTPEHIVNPW